MNTDWNNITMEAISSIWQGFLIYLPNLIFGMMILVFGWFVAVGFGKIVSSVLKKAKFDNFFEKEEWKEAMNKAKIKIKASCFIGSIVRWIIYVFFLWAAVAVFGLVYFAQFMREIVGYIPNIIVASLIFVVAVMLADFLSKIIVVTSEKAKFKHTYLAGEIARWSIWIFAGFAILIELGIARELLSIIFTGIIALIVIAGGIAFGLGGKEVAGDVLKNLKDKLKE
jgi:hypothetical protein